jgi:hypothetical protein
MKNKIVINFTANKFFETHCKLTINDVEIIACKLELFKNPVIDFINQEISAERERPIT